MALFHDHIDESQVVFKEHIKNISRFPDRASWYRIVPITNLMQNSFIL